MADLFRFIFSTFWIWLGTLLLLTIPLTVPAAILWHAIATLADTWDTIDNRTYLKERK